MRYFLALNHYFLLEIAETSLLEYVILLSIKVMQEMICHYMLYGQNLALDIRVSITF